MMNARLESFVRVVGEEPRIIFDHVVTLKQQIALYPFPLIKIDLPNEYQAAFTTFVIKVVIVKLSTRCMGS